MGISLSRYSSNDNRVIYLFIQWFMCLCIPVEPTKLLPEYENKIPKLFQPKFVVEHPTYLIFILNFYMINIYYYLNGFVLTCAWNEDWLQNYMKKLHGRLHVSKTIKAAHSLNF